MRTRLFGALALASITALVVPTSSTAEAIGTDVTYTTDADFDLGTLVGVNHDPPFVDQLQLDSPTRPFPFINVAASGRGTVVRVDTETGAALGEYATAPDGRGLDPSRTTVDLFGNVWTANREEAGEIDGTPHGSAVKIGLVVGGTRVDAAGLPDPSGDYLTPPYDYNTCVDRDADGLLRTSRGLHDILPWPDVTDGAGGPDGIVEDAVDECVLLYQRLPDAEQARHVSVNADNDVWVGGYPFEPRTFHLLDGTSGAFLDSFDARDFGCGGYGGLVDGNGIVWSIGWGTGEGALLRYDPATRTGMCVNTFGGYGLGVDTNGYVWASIWDNGIVKVSPDGVVEPGFPRSTHVPPMTATIAAASPFEASAASMTPAPPTLPTEIPSPSPMLGAALLADDAPEEAPDFWLAPDDDWVQSMNSWTPSLTVSLTIEDSSGVVYTDTQTVDSTGNFNFNLWEVFDLRRGHTVTISDGTVTKTHTVTNLFVDGIDVAADTVSGRADPGTTVDIWEHQTDAGLTVTADGSGNWVADFSGMTDLTYASDGGSQQADADGDATGVWWSGPTFTAAPDDDWVGSMSRWTPGTTVALTIEDGSGVVYTDTQTVDSTGNFNFNLWEVFDLQRGHTVTISDGTVTKTHTVTNLFVDGIDVAADTVSGRADPGTTVDIWEHQTDAGLTVTADGSGNWVADFSGMTDLTHASDGNSMQTDDDGDATWDFWQSPRFAVSPAHDWVGSMSSWTPGSTISLTIEDGSGVVYSDSQPADSNGNFNFNLGGGAFDVERGHIVTVFDGTITKTHQVIDLYVDGVDVDGDSVLGRGIAGMPVDVFVHGDSGTMVTVTVDGGGAWTADFTGVATLTYGSEGDAQQYDDDGDATVVWWGTPRFAANPDQEWVQPTIPWSPDSTVTLTVEDGSGIVFTDSHTVDENGNFTFDLWNVFDLERGQVLTVSDGATTKVHTMRELYVDGVDVVADTVFGRAEPGSQIRVWLHEVAVNVEVTADDAGKWLADLSGEIDLTYLSAGGAAQVDDDGDATEVHWRLPQIAVDLTYENVRGDGWSAGTELEIFVDGAPLTTVTTNPHGDFDILVGFDLESGQLVEVVGPMNTKSLLLGDPQVTAIDADTDQVIGTAHAGADLDVWAAVDSWSEPSMRRVIADGGGGWMADYSTPTPDFPALDLRVDSSVTTYEWDDDGDATIRNFGPPIQANRGVAVTPVDNHVWVANSGVDSVTRLDNDGNVLTVIEVGVEPTGVAVDAAGKVWVTNLGSDSAMRIDPTAGADGLGAIDLTVDLGEGASPYNYSDMTGAVVVGSTSPQGFWTVVQDSGEPGFEWGRIAWNTEPEALEPSGTAIVVEVRTSDSEAGLGAESFTPVASGELFSSFGRYIEVRVTLKASPEGVSPVLSDIRVQPALIEVDIDIKPGSDPNSINTKRTKGVVPVAVLGTEDFDVLTIDVTTLRFGPDLAAPAHDVSVRGGHLSDVDGDGDLDLVTHYVVGETGIAAGDTSACLVGETLGGIPIEGCDAVRTHR